MTEKEFLSALDEMIDRSSRDMKKNSLGAIKLLNLEDDNCCMGWVKDVLCALLQEEIRQWSHFDLTSKGGKESKSRIRMIYSKIPFNAQE